MLLYGWNPQIAVRFLSTAMIRRRRTAITSLRVAATAGRSYHHHQQQQQQVARYNAFWNTSKATTPTMAPLVYTSACTTTKNWEQISQSSFLLSMRQHSTSTCTEQTFSSQLPSPSSSVSSSSQQRQRQRQRHQRQNHPRNKNDRNKSFFIVSTSSARTTYDRIRRMILLSSKAKAEAADDNTSNSHHHNNNHNNNVLELHKYPAASLRQSYDFLLSAAARTVASQRKEHPLERLDLAKKLLEHVIQTAESTTATTKTTTSSSSSSSSSSQATSSEYNDVLTQFAIGSDLQQQGVHYGFGRLICQYLEPFWGTAKALYLTGECTKAADAIIFSLSDQQHALRQASQVADWMQHYFSLHSHSHSKDDDDDYCYNYPQLVPSVEYYEILCTLWSRRCRFLAQTNLHNDFSNNNNNNNNAQQRLLWQTPSVKNQTIQENEQQQPQQQQTQESFQQLVETGLGGAQTPQDCVKYIRLCLDEMTSLGILADDERVRIHELTCLANSGIPGASEQAIHVFERIQDTATKSFIPTLVGTVLLAFANELSVVIAATTTNDESQAAFFDKVMQFWKSIQDRYDAEYVRGPIVYSLLMRMASQVGNAQQAEAWLEEMERFNIQPSTIHYNIVLTALTNDNNSSSSRIPNIQRIEDVFRRMETMARAGLDTAPDKFSCTTLIKALLRSYEPMERAEAILTEMERSTDSRLRAESPAYTEFMNGLKERFIRAQELHVKEMIAIQMEKMLRRMEQRTRVDHTTVSGPNRYHLNSCLEMWSRSYSKLAPDRVKQLFADFCEQNPIVQPDGHTFRLILKALAIDSNHETISYAQRLLDRMKQEGLAEHIGVFNQYLHLLMKCRDSDCLEKAEKFVLQMEDDYKSGTSIVCPNGATYGIVLKEYSKQFGKERQAELWFARMLQLRDDKERADLEVLPDNFASLITVWAKSDQRQYALKRANALFAQAKKAGPATQYLYAAYQDAWSRLDKRNAPMQLEKILKEMQQNFDSGVNPHCRPNANNFSMLIGAWAAVGNMERAENILNHMEELARSSVAYKHLKPTLGCYRGVIQACMKSSSRDRASHAERILDRMEDRHHSKNRVAPLPDESCYIYAIVSVVKDGGPHAARRAQLLLQRINDSERNGRIKPSHKTYSALLRACAATTGSPNVKADAFRISKSILQAYNRKTGNPNEDVLMNFKHAAEKLLSKDQSSSSQIRGCPSEADAIQPNT